MVIIYLINPKYSPVWRFAMNNPSLNALVKFILPLALIIVLRTISIWLSVAGIVIYVAVLLYTARARIYSLMGARSYARGDMDKTIEWFERIYRLKNPPVRDCVSYAYILLKNGITEKADEILQNLLNKNPSGPDSPYIKSVFALVLWKKGKTGEAVKLLENVRENYVTTSVYESLGYMLIEQGDLEKALKVNLEAYDYNSDDKVIMDNLGQTYYLLGEYEKANEIYEKLMNSSPTFPEAYYNYGLLLDKLGDREKAAEMMKKALSLKFTALSTVSREKIEEDLARITDGISKSDENQAE